MYDILDMYYNDELSIYDLKILYYSLMLEDHINIEVKEILKENNLL